MFTRLRDALYVMRYGADRFVAVKSHAMLSIDATRGWLRVMADLNAYDRRIREQVLAGDPRKPTACIEG